MLAFTEQLELRALSDDEFAELDDRARWTLLRIANALRAHRGL